MKLFRSCLLVFTRLTNMFRQGRPFEQAQVVPINSFSSSNHAIFEPEPEAEVEVVECDQDSTFVNYYPVSAKFFSRKESDGSGSGNEEVEKEFEDNLAAWKLKIFLKSQSNGHAQALVPQILVSANMRDALFDSEQFNPSLFVDYDSLVSFYNEIMCLDAQRNRPELPFTVGSFLRYAFMKCDNLKLLASILELCRLNPGFLDFLKRWTLRVDDSDLREIYLLPFLFSIYRFDSNLAKMTLQLMGFANVESLKNFYLAAPDMPNYIYNLLDEFDWPVFEKSNVDLNFTA